MSPGPRRTDGERAPSVAPQELRERLRAGERLTLLDVRDREEVERWRIDGSNATAAQIPHAKFLQARVRGTAADLVADLPEPIVVVCARGKASADAAELLVDAGVEAANLAGGMEGWARLYEAVELDHPVATVLQYQRPASGCLAYLVVSGGAAAVIDPLRAFADRYVADARERGADLLYAVDTHVHADHVSGVRAVADASGAEAIVPRGARARGLAFDARVVGDREERSSSGSRESGIPGDGEALRAGEATLTAVRAPGHTSEMTAFRLDPTADRDRADDVRETLEPLLFAGDLLFLESVARPDLEEGDEGAPAAARRLHRTLRERALSLPDETLIAPAHYSDAAVPDDGGAYVATLGDLRERLSALSMDEEAFVEFVLSDVPPRPANFEEIIEINLGRREATDGEAFDLELGPNNCAATRTAPTR